MRRVGDTAVLLELPDNAAVHTAAATARERYGDQLAEIVPGHQTLLLVWADRSIVSDFAELALERASSARSDDEAPRQSVVTVPVRYEGADLDTVAARLGISREAVVKLHTEAEFVVAFMGFAPGFPYMVVPHASPLLDLPRLETPRREVPAGSVAVAAGYCGIYPRGSPGGWNLLGHTDAALFDPERDPPALLEPGARVRFERV